MRGSAAGWRERLRRALGHSVQHDLACYRGRLLQIRARASALRQSGAAEFATLAQRLRQRRADAPPDELLVDVFALVAESARRELGLDIYDEQLLAGLAMSEGKLAEMQTGEGKTLAAVAPVALRALSGAGAHVLTFNDYLARRDAAWMGPVYRRLGLDVAHVEQGLAPAQRRRAYAADVTYLTAKEAGFDFLRDDLSLEPEGLVQRPLQFALVDEADSILIDEARIPLVIAGEVDEPPSLAERMAALAPRLAPGEDFDTDAQRRNIALTDRGARRIEAALGCGSLYESHNLELLADARNALHAEHLLKRDVDYIVRDGRVELVDDFTGRVAERRQWPDGLQPAIEAKERLVLRRAGCILGSITMQHFLASYPLLCGMTATAQPAAEELAGFYGLGVVVIPTHAASRRLDHADVVFTHQEAKRRALIEEIAREHASGRPILVGTASVRESDELVSALSAAGVPGRVLNARNDALEAEIVAGAGARGAVTISTNMAGRGTDIRLGGKDESERDAVTALGGLYVIGTNRHESARVDQQLRGRAGRQGDPGATRFFVSLEDPLLLTYGVRELLADERPEPSSQPVAQPAVTREIARTQRIVESVSFDVRKRLWRYSSLVERERQVVRAWRRAILVGEEPLGLLAERCPERWDAVRARVGAEEAGALEQRLTLLAVDRCWSDHLALARRIRDGIHVVGFVGKDPLAEFTRELNAAFAELRDLIDAEIVASFEALRLGPEGVDWGQAALLGPSSTWTYLVNDQPFGHNPMRDLANRAGLATAASVFAGPVLLLWAAVLHLRRWLSGRASRRAGAAPPPDRR